MADRLKAMMVDGTKSKRKARANPSIHWKEFFEQLAKTTPFRFVTKEELDSMPMYEGR
jgi:hypothetical protein